MGISSPCEPDGSDELIVIFIIVSRGSIFGQNASLPYDPNMGPWSWTGMS